MPFSKGFRPQQLKTNLRLSINRLKLMEKKKTEIALKARKEIADYIQANKYDRARIRVEHIIREDYLVEGMELVEMYCDLLLARFGLIETMKYCDEGLVEAVSSIIWSAPRLSADCPELKSVADELALKYGKEFYQQSRSNMNETVNAKLTHKLSTDPAPKLLVERYLIEIARNYNVTFEPDPEVMMDEGRPQDFETIGGSYPTKIGFEGGFDGESKGSSMPPNGGLPPYPPNPSVSYPPNVPSFAPYLPPPVGANTAPGALPPYHQGNLPGVGLNSIPNLPDVPAGSVSNGPSDDADYDDLNRRFEELKKRK